MVKKKKIIGICGSASQNSANLALLRNIAVSTENDFDFEIMDDLTELPHFKTELTDQNTPEVILEFRNKIKSADGVIICTPEYVFSIPSGLKNMIEWSVSTTIFSNKPMGLITASANGEKGHEELELILKTVQATFTDETTLLIQGIKGKVNKEGEIRDEETALVLKKFLVGFNTLIHNFEY